MHYQRRLQQRASIASLQPTNTVFRPLYSGDPVKTTWDICNLWFENDVKNGQFCYVIDRQRKVAPRRANRVYAKDTYGLS